MSVCGAGARTGAGTQCGAGRACGASSGPPSSPPTPPNPPPRPAHLALAAARRLAGMRDRRGCTTGATAVTVTLSPGGRAPRWRHGGLVRRGIGGLGRPRFGRPTQGPQRTGVGTRGPTLRGAAPLAMQIVVCSAGARDSEFRLPAGPMAWPWMAGVVQDWTRAAVGNGGSGARAGRAWRTWSCPLCCALFRIDWSDLKGHCV